MSLLPAVALVTGQLPHDGARHGAVGGLVDVERADTDPVHVVPEGEAVHRVAAQGQALADQPRFVTSVARPAGLHEGVVTYSNTQNKSLQNHRKNVGFFCLKDIKIKILFRDIKGPVSNWICAKQVINMINIIYTSTLRRQSVPAYMAG